MSALYAACMQHYARLRAACRHYTGTALHVCGAGQAHTHTFRACPAPPHTRTARPLHADTEKRVNWLQLAGGGGNWYGQERTRYQRITFVDIPTTMPCRSPERTQRSSYRSVDQNPGTGIGSRNQLGTGTSCRLWCTSRCRDTPHRASRKNKLKGRRNPGV